MPLTDDAAYTTSAPRSEGPGSAHSLGRAVLHRFLLSGSSGELFGSPRDTVIILGTHNTTFTSQPSAAEVAVAFSWGTLRQDSGKLSPRRRDLTATDPGHARASVAWRDKIAALAVWRGDAGGGEAPSIYPEALKAAASIGTIAERMARIESVTADFDLFHSPDGGVQVEWSFRGERVEHLEIAILAHGPDRFDVLSTTESLDGQIEKVNVELTEATLAEALGALSGYLRRLAAISS